MIKKDILYLDRGGEHQQANIIGCLEWANKTYNHLAHYKKVKGSLKHTKYKAAIIANTQLIDFSPKNIEFILETFSEKGLPFLVFLNGEEKSIRDKIKKYSGQVIDYDSCVAEGNHVLKITKFIQKL
ncbi:MAG: hypothetical protein KKF48_01980 [Nanoarchaeota archaeon]|nr:hypothetical protein [Nanoarchaeota archaeon]MBU1027789.1 hypothetical protein [Nanoarchaeota archaeon]